MRGENDAEDKGSTPRAPSEPQGARAARRALIIEDNFDAAETLRIILEFREHVVDVAYSGPEALDKARTFKPDIVLCDIGLPGMDGYAVARALRADPALDHVPLVALTGYAEPEDIARAQAAGFDAHVVKPPDMTALLQLSEGLEAAAGRAP